MNTGKQKPKFYPPRFDVIEVKRLTGEEVDAYLYNQFGVVSVLPESTLSEEDQFALEMARLGQ